MQGNFTCFTGTYLQLSTAISKYKFLILHNYNLETLYLREQGSMNILRNQMGADSPPPPKKRARKKERKKERKKDRQTEKVGEHYSNCSMW
jgi:hypothetical protein